LVSFEQRFPPCLAYKTINFFVSCRGVS